MKFKNIANISQGIMLSRIKIKDEITDKSLVYSFTNDAESYIDIPKNKNLKNDMPFTQKGMILLNLSSHRATVIEDQEEGMIIPSTFIILNVKNGINPYYLEWYINESRDFYKKLHAIKQGSLIQAIPIQYLKEIDLVLPHLEVQEKIARINALMKKKHRLQEEKEKLLKDVLKYINQEGIDNYESTK